MTTRATSAQKFDVCDITLKPRNAHFETLEDLTNYSTESEPWEKSLAKSFRNHLQLTSLFNNVEDTDHRVYKSFDCRITPYTAQLMDVNDPRCPIRIQYLPNSAEIDVKPYEIEDSLGEDGDMIPNTVVVHRYPQRVLFLVHNTCASLCRYCTRKRFVTNSDRNVVKDEIEHSLDYLESATEVQDCLLSGGDPLMLPDARLDYILGGLRRRAPHIKFLRIGTRMPVQLPTRITPALCAILERHNVQMVNIHVNHPKEITPLLVERVKMLRKTGVMLGNQTVLLRGVNDDVDTLRKLCMGLIEMGVRPYYVYSCDPAEGNDQFIVSIEKAKELYEGLRGWISGPAIPTFVVDGVGGLGKLPIMPEYVSYNEYGGVFIRNYKGMTNRMDFLHTKNRGA
jgi:lysine 2,3-aminomutase